MKIIQKNNLESCQKFNWNYNLVATLKCYYGVSNSTANANGRYIEYGCDLNVTECLDVHFNEPCHLDDGKLCSTNIQLFVQRL